MKDITISNAFRTKETSPALSILQAVVSAICPKKLRNPTANKRIHAMYVFGIMSSKVVISKDVK